MATAAVIPIRETKPLLMLAEVKDALAEVQGIGDALPLIDKAEALRVCCKKAGLSLEIQNQATEIKIRAEREAGRMLAELKLNGGDRKSQLHDERVKLADLGITSTRSHRWQRAASVPEDVFNEHLEAVNEAGKELTTAGVLRLADSNPKPADKELTLGDCLEMMRDLVVKMWHKWPADERDALGHQLKCLSKEVLGGKLVTECVDDSGG